VYIIYDITKRKIAEQRLERLALYDTLTGLPNRTLFFDRMNQLLALAKRNQYVLAVLYMDMDRFKVINDTLGHEVGDLLLQEAAKRMTSCTRKADTVARMGGDEFIGICARIAAAEDASVVARKIIAALAEPFTIKGNECSIGVSIGISLYPRGGDDSETLVNKADTAMYRVKESGKGGYAFSPLPRAALFILSMNQEGHRALFCSGGIVALSPPHRPHPPLGIISRIFLQSIYPS
jgi:diguanylate cyclase (GGDEF)-like protein